MQSEVGAALNVRTITAMSRHQIAIAVCSAALLAASCSGSDDSTTGALFPDDEIVQEAPGIRAVPATEALAIQGDPPADLVILDVRTPEEFAEGHVDGAVMLDFYDPEFSARIADLDPNVSYLLYCRSGNRSGQTAELMSELGFINVADVDGGILAWSDAGQPLVTD